MVDLDANAVSCGEVLVQLPERERTKLLAQLKEAVSGALPPPGRNVPSIFVAFPGGRCPARTSAGAGGPGPVRT